ncbi:MAG: threonine--tRNA ligase [Actinobacteria bacterium]|nr:threonine--tRNA ligase [Actinomycetota bacterium]
MVKIQVEGLGEIKSNEGLSIFDLISIKDKVMAKRAVLAELTLKNGLKGFADLSFKINKDLKIKLLFPEDEKSIDTLNHSTSHVMASAIKDIYPEAKFAIGPSIKNGFYYDFEIDSAISPEDLKIIEDRMKKIVAANYPFERREVSRDEAREIFKENPYKLELIDDIKDEKVSIYKSGDFIDLCSGPHIPSTGRITAFKLLSIAGAYWRGNEKNKMLIRIYGTAFFSKEDLKEYLDRIERARLSDHRKIGKDLDLFSFHDEAPGFPFWHPKGMIIRNLILDYWRKVHEENGYQEIQTPIILSNELWHTSGHWDHYKENMYFVKIDECDFAVKPMNCPGAILIYKSRQHSYKEFPIRYAELGLVHRHEKSGVLHGLFRVRNFTQDDAHIFVLEENLGSEITGIINMIGKMYEVFGFKEYHVELSTRPDDRIGSDEMWDRAELELENAIKGNNLEYKINPGDGAFYGPKIDFHIKDSLERTWQCATIQLDFAMPEKFGIGYMGEDNLKHRPVMIHRVILGSVERFIGILIENYSGILPLWIAPVQAAILPISDKFSLYSEKIYNILRGGGFRVELDSRVESLNKKIRQAELNKIPLMIVIGEKEQQSETVTIRKKAGGDIKNISIKEFLNIFKENVENKKTSV